MKIQVIPGAPAQEVVQPSDGMPVPEGFIEALKTAAKFAGQFAKLLADAQYVHVVDGKAYVSNNRHIAEIDVGPTPFASLRLSKKDITLLSRFDGDPARATAAEGFVEFTWADQQWVRIDVGTVSSEFVENCRSRLDEYWREPKDRSLDPKVVDGLLQNAPKGTTISITADRNRAIGMDDGFFFPAGKASLTTLIQEERFDPLRDDLFASALKETKGFQKKNVARAERLRKRLRSIQDDIDALEAENVELDEKLVCQHEAIEAYQNGEDLDDKQRALLTPQCRDLTSTAKKQALQTEFEKHEDSIPVGWEVTGKRQDDDYIYVTIRRERVTTSKAAETAAAKVKKALAKFFKPGFGRDFRIRWDQLGTLSPIVRGAP